jgi:hypothetical protein
VAGACAVNSGLGASRRNGQQAESERQGIDAVNGDRDLQSNQISPTSFYHRETRITRTARKPVRGISVVDASSRLAQDHVDSDARGWWRIMRGWSGWINLGGDLTPAAPPSRGETRSSLARYPPDAARATDQSSLELSQSRFANVYLTTSQDSFRSGGSVWIRVVVDRLADATRPAH